MLLVLGLSFKLSHLGREIGTFLQYFTLGSLLLVNTIESLEVVGIQLVKASIKGLSP